ncbi:MAG TPA: hypothetical protein VLE73_03280 [Candidatus Saccharimonadales bacterium]|nr:hypothetical protein [Candidatus Saccharimonadales bacterium]
MPTLFIHEQSTLSYNQFRVYESAGEQSGRLIAYAEHKRGTPRDALFFYKDEHGAEVKEGLVFKIKMRSAQELEPLYDVSDEENHAYGSLQKEFTTSKWHDSWRVFAPDTPEPIALIKERVPKLGAAEHFWKRLPFLGEQPFVLTYAFNFCDPITNTVIGACTKQKPFNGMYRIDINETLAPKGEWCLFVAACAALNGLS